MRRNNSVILETTNTGKAAVLKTAITDLPNEHCNGSILVYFNIWDSNRCRAELNCNNSFNLTLNQNIRTSVQPYAL